MSTADMDEILLAEAEIALSNVQARQRVVTGYETGLCPGRQVHLDLRFRDQPSTGVDGRTFPAALWEQSPKFTLPGQHIRLAGVGAFNSKRDVMGNRPGIDENSELDRAAWKAALRRHMNVRARWFVLHDTAGGGVPASARAIGQNESGVHLFMDQSGLFLHHDFSTEHTAVRFEQLHREFSGELIHVEHVYPKTPAERAEDAAAAAAGRQPRAILVPNAPPPPGGYNYEALALAYIFASYRAGSWLTVTCHLELDRGVSGGHHDPRGFRYASFYQRIITLVGGPTPPISIIPQPLPVPPFFIPVAVPNPVAVPAGSTFGILDARIGDGLNQDSYINTFPAQYGPVQTNNPIRRSSGGRRARRT